MATSIIKNFLTKKMVTLAGGITNFQVSYGLASGKNTLYLLWSLNNGVRYEMAIDNDQIRWLIYDGSSWHQLWHIDVTPESGG